MPKATIEKEVESLLKEKDSYQARARKLLRSLDEEISSLQAKRDALAAMLGDSTPKARSARRSKGTRKRVDVSKSELKALLAKGMTSNQIADHYGVAAMTVAGWKRKFGLTDPKRGRRAGKKVSKKAAGKRGKKARTKKKAVKKKSSK